MPSADRVWPTIEPGIQISPKGDRYSTRWQRNGQQKRAYFDTIEEARQFRKVNGLGKSSPTNSERGRRSLENLKRGQAVANKEWGNKHNQSHGGKAKVTKEELEAKQQEVYAAIAADVPVRDHSGEMAR